MGKVYEFPAADQAAGPARLRLWELPAGCLCPLVGMGLPIDGLRELLNALFAGESELDDFQLHASAIRECSRRNKVAEAIEAELDRRHGEAIDETLACAGEEELARQWARALHEGDVPGAMWATLGHGLCSDTLRQQIVCDVHMAQHRALIQRAFWRGRDAALTAEVSDLRARLRAAENGSPPLRGRGGPRLRAGGAMWLRWVSRQSGWATWIACVSAVGAAVLAAG